MNEFRTQEGGRFVYTDDIANLQDLALAFSAVFDDCDNFVISGCQVSNGKILEGYVYINGKIRRVAETTVSSFPQYIYESNSIEMVNYEVGGSKVGRHCYRAAIASSVPTAADPLTGVQPQSIKVTELGALTIKEALFGRYSLLLSGQNQQVDGKVAFSELAASSVKSDGGLVIAKGSISSALQTDGNNLMLKHQYASGRVAKITLKSDGNVTVHNGNVQVAEFTSTGLNTAYGIRANSFSTADDGVSVTGDVIKSNKIGVATVRVNFDSNGTPTKNFAIYDGALGEMFYLDGANKTISVNANTTFAHTSRAVVTLNQTSATGGSGQVLSFCQLGAERAYIGFNSGTDTAFTIKAADIKVDGTLSVSGSIREQGVLLSNKYVKNSTFSAFSDAVNSSLSRKADVEAVYPMRVADEIFAAKNGGFSQFITSGTDATALRNQINAAAVGDIAASGKKDVYSWMSSAPSPESLVRTNIYNKLLPFTMASYEINGGNLHLLRWGNCVRISMHGVQTYFGIDGRQAVQNSVVWDGDTSATIPFPSEVNGALGYNGRFYFHGVSNRKRPIRGTIAFDNRYGSFRIAWYNDYGDSGEYPKDIHFTSMYFIYPN